MKKEIINRKTIQIKIKTWNNPAFEIEQTDASGDAAIRIITSGGNTFSLGIDASDSDKFKISDNQTLGSNDRLVLKASGTVTIPGTLDISTVPFSPKIYYQTSKPNVPNNTTAFWGNSSIQSYYLILDYNGTLKKIELQ